MVYFAFFYPFLMIVLLIYIMMKIFVLVDKRKKDANEHQTSISLAGTLLGTWFFLVFVYFLVLIPNLGWE